MGQHSCCNNIWMVTFAAALSLCSLLYLRVNIVGSSHNDDGRSSTAALPARFLREKDAIGGAVAAYYHPRCNGENRTHPAWCSDKRCTKPLFHIFVASPPHTASTLLANMLYGFLCPQEAIAYKSPKRPYSNSCPITKTHEVDLRHISASQSRHFERVYFISSQRHEHRIKNSEALCLSANQTDINVLCLDYDEFVYGRPSERRQKVKSVAAALQSHFPGLLGGALLDVDAAVERCVALDKRVAELADAPFKTHDDFYQVHGHHRGRTCDVYKGRLACTRMEPGKCSWVGRTCRPKTKNSKTLLLEPGEREDGVCQLNPADLCKIAKTIDQDKEITIVTFGGSVSWGATLESRNSTYTELLADKLRKRGKAVKTVNLSIRATGPITSFFCLHHMLEGAVPDIVVMEFSINGGQWTSEQSGMGEAKYMRGLIHRLRQDFPTAALLYVSLFSPRSALLGLPKYNYEHRLMFTFYRDYPQCDETMVWSQEGLTVVSLHRALAKSATQTLPETATKVRAGGYEIFASDHHHLNEVGHALVADRLDRILQRAANGTTHDTACRSVVAAAVAALPAPKQLQLAQAHSACYLFIRGDEKLEQAASDGTTKWTMQKLSTSKYALVTPKYKTGTSSFPRDGRSIAFPAVEALAASSTVYISYMSMARTWKKPRFPPEIRQGQGKR